MKIAISGKGGVGKTTIGALLCRALERRGRDVIAVDADSNPNLGCALGVPGFENITPLAEMRELIREKTGAEKGSYGAYFKMNPDVTDIPERFRLTSGNVQLLTMGSVTQGNSGCVCPEYVLIKNLISYLLLNGEQDMVIDMEAGLEHLGRGVTQKVDVLFIVTQPDRVSCLTASRIYRLANDLNVQTVLGIGNEVRDDDDKEFLKKAVDDFDFAAFFPECKHLREHIRDGRDIADISELNDAAEELLIHITEKVNG